MEKTETQMRIDKQVLKKLNLLKVELEMKSGSKTIEFLMEFYKANKDWMMEITKNIIDILSTIGGLIVIGFIVYGLFVSKG